MAFSSEHTVVNVISQNILLDKTRTREGLILPQDDRIASIAATLGKFPGELDVVGIQEAHRSKYQHNGEALAELCGYAPGVWAKHNEKPYAGSSTGRSNEYIGLFGARVDQTNTEIIDLGDRRRAVMTTIAGVAFATIHLRAGGYRARPLRGAQVEHLMEAIDPLEDAVIFGDFNEPPIRMVSEGRDKLRKRGFLSVFPLTGQSHPKTFPIPSYREIHGARSSWSLDDILIRGERVTALAAGVLERIALETNDGESQDGSDHEGVWATLEVA